jgi:uncharacterized damage-inducible protein DinB
MEHDRSLRDHLRKLVDWEDAHAGFDAAVEGLPPGLRGKAPAGLPHSPWQLLEHLRRCQKDILDFCLRSDYVEPKSMDEYWPASAAPPSKTAWDESVAAFRQDREALRGMADDRAIDLFAPVPQGKGQTYLRELLLVADHNAYHVGQLVLTRRLLGDWT